MDAKLTDWFPGSIKPVRPGVYQQMCGFGERIGYQKWDGEYWYSREITLEAAHRAPYRAYTQDDPWRGLAYDPAALPNSLMPTANETD